MQYLGHPELAVGDSYKALLLIEAGLDHSSKLGDNVREAVRLVWGDEQEKVFANTYALNQGLILGRQANPNNRPKSKNRKRL